MNNLKNVLLLFDKLRLVQQCSCKHLSKSSKGQEARFMMKIITGSRKPKGKVLRQLEFEKQNNQVFASKQTSFTIKGNSAGKVNHRRRELLNAVFTRHIIDHLATSRLQGLDIQITNVTVSPDISLVKAQWISRSCLTGHDGPLQAELDLYAAVLRKDLSDLRIIGVVPPIKFIPDRILAQGAVVDQLLKTAEMSSEEPLVEDDGLVDFMPPMRQDALGLDREKIMTKIAKKGLKHSSATFNDGTNESISLAQINSAIEEFKKLRKKSLREEKMKKRDWRALAYEDFARDRLDEPDYDQATIEDYDFMDEDDERK